MIWKIFSEELDQGISLKIVFRLNLLKPAYWLTSFQMFLINKSYHILGCDLNYNDCRNDWKYEATIFGHCLRFFRKNSSKITQIFSFNPSANPKLRKAFGRRPRLSLTFVQNETDSTFGWNGVMQVGFSTSLRIIFVRKIHNN